MVYLLDTQVVIWALTNPDRIPKKAKALIEDEGNEILVSDISLFEIVIKQTIGKLPEFAATIPEIIIQLEAISIQIKAVSNAHIANYANVPFNTNHKDPFDRILLATAHYEGVTIISSDDKFQLYSKMVEVIWE